MKTLLTPQGSIIVLDKPAYASFATVLNNKGRKVLDKLKLTGKTATITQFGEQYTEFECKGTFDTFFINELDLIQY